MKNVISFFFIKIAICLSPRPPQRTSKLQEKPSALKRERPALKRYYGRTGHSKRPLKEKNTTFAVLAEGVISILLRLYTFTEHLKTVDRQFIK
jgi:hypothetical protein